MRPENGPGICVAGGCTRKRNMRGRKKDGTPRYALLCWTCINNGERASGVAPVDHVKYTEAGYKQIKQEDGKYKYEHRMVMEEIEGRELYDFENVHHKNGIRDDNRPENLELWAKPQQPGQRVEDLVDFIVNHYPERCLAQLTRIDKVKGV